MSVSSDVELESCSARLVDPSRVAEVLATMPAEAEVTDVADVFGLLSDTGLSLIHI